MRPPLLAVGCQGSGGDPPCDDLRGTCYEKRLTPFEYLTANSRKVAWCRLNRLTVTMKPASLARSLSSGIYGKLEFDFACNRGHAFSEVYLYGIIMEILASNFGAVDHNVQPSYALPELQRPSGGPGRKREVDFAVVSRVTGALDVCLEAKWSASSHATAKNVFYDLLRLALVSEANPDTTCLFLLAGGKTSMGKLMMDPLFRPHGSQKKPKQLLLAHYEGKLNTYPIKTGVGEQSVLPQSLRAEAQSTYKLLPCRVSSYEYKPPHADPPDWSVRVWRVESSGPKVGK